MSETVVEDASVKWISEIWGKDITDESLGSVSFLSFPFDHCVSHRPGTRHGPASILNALGTYSSYCTDRRADLSALQFVDSGIVPATNEIHRYYEMAQKAVASVPGEHQLVCLGGDHSVGDPIIRGQILRTDQKVGLIMIDAHFDSRPPIIGAEHSGHWIHTLGDVMDYKSLAQIGINASIYAGHYVEKAEADGTYLRTASELHDQGAVATMDAAITHILQNCERFHITLDIDAIDQAFCPGTSVPNPCGLFPQQIVDMLYLATKHPAFIGFDIMEVSPPLDTEDRTSHVAAQIILHAMAGMLEHFARLK